MSPPTAGFICGISAQYQAMAFCIAASLPSGRLRCCCMRCCCRSLPCCDRQSTVALHSSPSSTCTLAQGSTIAPGSYTTDDDPRHPANTTIKSACLHRSMWRLMHWSSQQCLSHCPHVLGPACHCHRQSAGDRGRKPWHGLCISASGRAMGYPALHTHHDFNRNVPIP
jgi:hypothetical protein